MLVDLFNNLLFAKTNALYFTGRVDMIFKKKIILKYFSVFFKVTLHQLFYFEFLHRNENAVGSSRTLH